MSSFLDLSIRFLDTSFHGRGDAGEPEWPPSPMRMFQALVAAAARSGQATPLEGADPLFIWLEGLPAPYIVAPQCRTGIPIRIAVPNNDLDVVAAVWAKRQEPKKQPNELKTMKTVQPTWLFGGDTVHYLWPLPDPLPIQAQKQVSLLRDIARRVVVLGWGIDMVVGHASIVSDQDAAALAGERWLAGIGQGARSLRVPTSGSMRELIERHGAFLRRLDENMFTAPPLLSAFRKVAYRRETEPPVRPMAAFSLLKPDASAYRAFDASRRALTVAGMVRHATRQTAKAAGWGESKINAFVLGHAEAQGEGQHVTAGPNRFAYLPLPSIESRGDGKSSVGSVRRVIVTTFAEGCDTEIAWAQRALSGQELLRDGTDESEERKGPVALLSLIPSKDKMVQHYVGESSTWTTVTPVVLPGYDDPSHYRRRLRKGVSAEEQKQFLDRLSDRVNGLLRKAIRQAGFSETLAANAEIGWRSTGYLAGLELSSRYGVPSHLKRFPRLHVKLKWHDSNGNAIRVPGPICIGGGRFYGVGLFVALDDNA